MARFQIFSKDGRAVRHSGCPTYNGVYLKPSYIEFREICSPTPIDWQVGDYVDYNSDSICKRTGYRYRLYDIPQPTKKATAGKSGESFVYQSVQLFAPTKDLELCPFRDLVPNDNYIHYSTRQDVSTFENLEGIVGRIQKNLDDWYGTGKWSIRIASGLPTDLLRATKEARLFSVSGGSVLDAINKCYEVYDDIGWRFSMVGSLYVLTFGAANVAPNAGNTTKLLKYGFDNSNNALGLVSISSSQSNKDEFGTRLYAFGSSRNMNFQYYRQDESILNAESLDIQNLMIPKERWGKTGGKYDAHLAVLVNAEAEALYGKRARYHYFDGSDDDEIFPSLEGVTIGQIRNSGIADYSPSTAIYRDNSERVDYPRNDVHLADDGQLYDAGKKVVLPGAMTDTVMSWRGDIRYGEALRKDIGTYAFTPTPGKWKITLDANYRGMVAYPAANLSAYLNIERRYTKGGVQHDDLLIGYPCLTAATKKSFDFKIPNEDGKKLELEVEIEDIPGTTNNQLVFVIQLMYTHQYTGALPIDAQLISGKNTLNFTLERDYSKTFFLNLKQIGFNIADRQAQGNTGIGTILFNEGMCGGRSFAIKSCAYVDATDSWQLECIRAYDESTGMVYPNRDYIITTADRFVLLDIAMPDLYIKAAEQRLYERAQQLLAEISQIKKAYVPSLDSKMLAMAPTMMEEGMYMAIQDGEITDGVVFKGIIDNITISEGEASIPTYRVTIRDDKSRSFKNSLNTGASSTPLTSLSSGVKEATNYEDLSGKPKLGGRTITGDKSLDDYDIQQKLVPGDNISIDGNVISSKGGGGTPITVDAELSETSTNPAQNKAITAAINKKADDETIRKDIADTYLKKTDDKFGTLAGRRLTLRYLNFFESDDATLTGSAYANLIERVTTRTRTGAVDTDKSFLSVASNLFIYGWLKVLTWLSAERYYFQGAGTTDSAPYIEYDDSAKAIKIHGNVYATGYVSSGGVGGQGGSSAGDVTCVQVNGSVVYPDGTGKITLPDYPGAGDVRWDDIVNKPAWIGDSKPSYSFSEIGGTLPASRVTGLPDYPDLSKYYNADNANRSDVDWTAKDLNAQRVVIAGHVVEYDTKNDAFKFNGNVYATGFVSAGGTGGSGGISGGIIPTEIPILTTRQMSDTEFFEIAHNGITSSEVAYELLMGQRKAYNSDGDFFTCSGRYTSEKHWRLTFRDWGEIMDGGTEIEIRNNNGTINYTCYER